ncbi:unnamed protein product [Owenia fusiformis]|uniref:Uncharacterized protein n=1 Tax=Owenia fusiformis TaxID=6347 RepID=A0A8J1TXK7_OWEFU|nr:unnamed protein product [Owenia fusiformis]
MPGVMNGYGNRYPDDQYDDGYRRGQRPPGPGPGYVDPYSDAYREDTRDPLYSKPHREPSSHRYDQDRPPVNNNDLEPMFNLDHLATFTVGPKQGLVTPNDGIRKLHQMERTTGVWTMRCKMVVERRDIVILDSQTSDEMERFPIELVEEPTAVTNSDPKNVYNNIVLFTVIEDKRAPQSSPSEMHIFQCISQPAIDVVEDIKRAKSGQTFQKHSYQPPPLLDVATGPHNGVSNVQKHVEKYEKEAVEFRNSPPISPYGPSKRQWSFNNKQDRDDDASSISSERLERETQILNHCFDDIEKFVARLQQSADAFKELNRRNRSGSRQRKDRRHGDGILTMRAKTLPVQDFVDIFQKFKLSFNLLARLKAHIHQPNAPELIHYLFTPLTLIIDASKDRDGSPVLAQKVISPLLTRDAIELLVHCLTSKEQDLWMSMGDSWTISREQWKAYAPPYNPRFYDGWQPHPSLLEEFSTGAGMASVVMAHQDQIRRPDERPRDDYDRQYQRDREQDIREKELRDRDLRDRELRDRELREREMREREQRERDELDRERREREQLERERRDRELREREMEKQRERERIDKEREQRYGKPNFEDTQRRFLESLLRSGAMACEVTHDRVGKNEKELTVQKGEIIEVMDNSRNWWKLRNANGDMGHAPYTILKEYQQTGSAPGPPRDSYDRRDPYDDRLNQSQNQHRYENHPSDRNDRNDHNAPYSSNRPTSGDYNDYLPEPTPPPPAPLSPTRLDSEVEKRRGKKVKAPPLNLHEELKRELTHGKNRQKRNVKQGVTLYIGTDSSVDEVQEWMRSKEFTERTCNALIGKTGLDMFNLSRNQMETICGPDEAARLDSQIKVQKNISGYKTQSAVQLTAILQQRKRHDGSENNYSLGKPPEFSPDSPQCSNDNSEDDSDNESSSYPAGNTLRDMLRRQRSKIMMK